MLRIWGWVGVLMLACACGSSKAGTVQASGGGGDAQNGGGPNAVGGAASCSHGDIQLFATQVSGTVTVNGVAFTGSLDQEEAELVLRNAANDYAPLTPITANGGAYSALIAPGSYDLYYRHSGASVALPSNDFAVLQRGLVVGSAPLTLDIDVPVGTVSGTVTVAGKVFHDPTDNEEGLIDLHSATYGRARLASTLPADGSYSALVIAGSYDVVYQHATSVDTPGNALPGNGAGKVRSGISVDRGATLSLDLDVPVSTVTVALEINGAPVTNQAELTLRNATDGIELARTAPGKNTFFARVVPGDRYDLYYSAQELGPNVVTNAQAIIQTGIDVGATPVSLTVDVAATALSGNVTLNGAPVTLINGDNLYLKTAAGDQVPLTPSGGAYSALVVQGTYDLYFDSSQSGIADLPETTTKLQSGVVIGPSPLSLDIQIPTPTRVSGTITVNGASIGGNHSYFLVLGDSEKNGTIIASSPAGGAYSALVFPGTYDVSFQGQEDGADLPHNFSAAFKTGVVVGTSPLALDIDIPAATLSGTVTFNGELRSDTLADLEGASFLIRLANVGPTSIATRLGDAGKYTSFVIPGTYQLSYVVHGTGHGFPSNQNLALGCLIVE